MSKWHLMSETPKHNHMCILANLRESITRYGAGVPYQLAWYCDDCKPPKWIGRNGIDLSHFTHWTIVPSFDVAPIQDVDYEKEREQFNNWYEKEIKPLIEEV